MSAENTTNLEAIRDELKSDLEEYIESNRKRTDSYLSLAMDIESMFEYAQSIHETDAETAESISQLVTNLLPRWKEMTLIATDGRFEEAFSIYQYIRLEVDLAREGHMRKHLQVTDPSDTYIRPDAAESPQAQADEILSKLEENSPPKTSDQPDKIQLVDATFFDFLRDDVTIELNQLSLTLGKIIANKGDETDWKNLRLLCDSIKESSVVFGFEDTIDIAEAAWQIAYAADQYPAQRTVEAAQNVLEVLQCYAELIAIPFEALEPDSKIGNSEPLSHRVSIRSKPAAAGLARKVTKPKLKVLQTIAKQTFEAEAAIPSANNDEFSADATSLQLNFEEPQSSFPFSESLAPNPASISVSENESPTSENTSSTSSEPDAPEPKTERLPATEPESSAQPLDQELRDLFRDEAAGYLSELAVELRCLRSTPQELPVWEIVRRLTHTIKGSAAMVGMDDISDEAWTAEQLAHTAIKEPAQRSSSRADRVVRLISGIAKLLAVPFNVPNPDPPAEAPKPAVIPTLPKSILHSKLADTPPATSAGPTPKAATPPPQQTAPLSVRPAIQLPVPVSIPPPKKETAPIDANLDPELQNMFREEVSAFLKDLSLELARLRRSEQDVDIWEIVKRLCNTIKGSALMVGLEDISDEAWSAEQLAQTAIKEPAQRTTSRADRIVRLMTGIAKKFGITFTVASPTPAVTTQS